MSRRLAPAQLSARYYPLDDTLAQQLKRLCEEGSLERRGPYATLFQYRITERGKRDLAGLLARGIVEDVAGEVRA